MLRLRHNMKVLLIDQTPIFIDLHPSPQTAEFRWLPIPHGSSCHPRVVRTLRWKRTPTHLVAWCPPPVQVFRCRHIESQSLAEVRQIRKDKAGRVSMGERDRSPQAVQEGPSRILFLRAISECGRFMLGPFRDGPSEEKESD